MMRAVIMDGEGGVTLADVAVPIADRGEVIIAPDLVGICGTDLHLAAGEYPLGRFPLIGGHEFSGRVTATGEGVTRFRVGDCVCVDPNICCGICPRCRDGAVNLCESLIPVGVQRPGGFAQRVALPEKVVHLLPAQLDSRAGVLIEPLACVLHGFDRVPSVQGRSVLVFGAGSVGLLAIALAVHRGASRVEVVEPSAVRRAAALEFGVQGSFVPGGRGARRDIDLVIEASGHPGAVAEALDQLAVRGTLLQMGVCAPDARIALAPFDLFDREISLVGSQSLAGCYERAIVLMTELDGLVDKMVSHAFELEQAAEAFRTARSESARKVVLRCT